MVNTGDSSFIPKHGPKKRKPRNTSRQVYVFTIVAYILIFSTLLAAGAVVLYGKYIDKQLENEVNKLSVAISNFSETDMLKIMEFDSRLDQAMSRVENSASVTSIFSAIENSTIGSVKIDSLDLQRVGDESFSLKAEIETDSFDSTMFQRDIYKDHETVDSIVVSELTSSEENVNEVTASEEGSNDDKPRTYTFSAELSIPLSNVAYEGESEEVVSDEEIIITEPTSELESEILGLEQNEFGVITVTEGEEESVSEEVLDNQENI